MNQKVGLIGKNKMKELEKRGYHLGKVKEKKSNQTKKKNPDWYNQYTKDFNKKHKLEENQDEEMQEIMEDLF